VSVRKLSLITAAAFAVAAPAALAGTSVSHSNFWQNHAKTAVCGKRITVGSFHLLCSAQGIPRPSTGSQGGDPFVVLRRTGRPHLVLLSQREFPGGNPQTLADGSKWSKDGITCTLNHKVTCKNTSGHGFTIGNGKYKSF
jgi:hypothetical protein